MESHLADILTVSASYCAGNRCHHKQYNRHLDQSQEDVSDECQICRPRSYERSEYNTCNGRNQDLGSK